MSLQTIAEHGHVFPNIFLFFCVAAQFGQVVNVDFYGGMKEDESTGESNSFQESASQRSSSDRAARTATSRERARSTYYNL